MTRPSFPSKFRRAAASLLAFLLLPGCSTWRPMPGSPDASLIPPDERSVRVELEDGSRFELRSPEVLADTLLVGVRLLRRFDPEVARLGREEPRRIATAQLIGLETRQKDKTRTAICTTIVGVGFLMLTTAIMKSIQKGIGEGIAEGIQEWFPDRHAPPPPSTQ